jgi:hypothetical protein
MNGIFKKLINLMAFIVFINSCQIEKEFDYNDSFSKSKLAVFALINEKNIEVEIRKTLEPLGINSADSVSDVKISLFENDVYLFDLLKVTSYNYKSPEYYTPQINKNYQITCIAEGFDFVSSTSQALPPKVFIDTCWYKDFDNYSMIYATFSDPSPIGNAYYLGARLYFNGEEINEEEFIEPFGVFNDQTFNNTRYTTEKEMHIKIYEYDYENQVSILHTADSVIITLYSLSEELKYFLESFESYDLSNRSPIYEQPFQIYTNIINGYGFLGAYCVDKYTIVFDTDSI